MAINYVSLAATALRLIDENGRNVRFIHASRADNVNSQPWRAPGTTGPDRQVVVTVKAVDHPYTQYEIDEQAIRRGDNRCYVAYNAFLTAAEAADVAATGTLTLSGQPLDTETVTIGGKVYTFETILTNVDGHVQIGATTEDSLDNLVAAINLAAGAGTLYAASTTLHATVSAADGTGTTVVVTAKTAGAGGNIIATTESLTDGLWAGSTLSGGLTANRNLDDYDFMEELNGERFRVLKANPIKPADVTVLYDIQMRR